MNKFIEKNRRLLTFYCIAARVVGWVLFIFGAIGSFGFFSILAAILKSDESRKILPNDIDIPSAGFKVINIMLLGLVILGIAQFIRYLFESLRRPGWILRHGDKILHLYVVLLIGHTVYSAIFTVRDFYLNELLYFVLLTIAKVLILIGLGDILKRVMPVIEESKTLV